MAILISGRPEVWGIIPSFLDESDPRSAKEQFNEHYQGGWRPFEGFTLGRSPSGMPNKLMYDGDPPMKILSVMLFRDEFIAMFECEWVLILQKDNTWEVCRMD